MRDYRDLSYKHLKYAIMIQICLYWIFVCTKYTIMVSILLYEFEINVQPSYSYILLYLKLTNNFSISGDSKQKKKSVKKSVSCTITGFEYCMYKMYNHGLYIYSVWNRSVIYRVFIKYCVFP